MSAVFQATPWRCSLRCRGVNDEQVMTAVELYGAKEDPGFKPILRRIASTLSTSLS